MLLVCGFPPIQVYNSYSLRADSLMGEFKVSSVTKSHQKMTKGERKSDVWLVSPSFTQLDVGYVYDEPGEPNLNSTFFIQLIIIFALWSAQCPSLVFNFKIFVVVASLDICQK